MNNFREAAEQLKKSNMADRRERVIIFLLVLVPVVLLIVGVMV
jgi:hypothetical protein